MHCFIYLFIYLVFKYEFAIFAGTIAVNLRLGFRETLKVLTSLIVKLREKKDPQVAPRSTCNDRVRCFIFLKYRTVWTRITLQNGSGFVVLACCCCCCLAAYVFSIVWFLFLLQTQFLMTERHLFWLRVRRWLCDFWFACVLFGRFVLGKKQEKIVFFFGKKPPNCATRPKNGKRH